MINPKLLLVTGPIIQKALCRAVTFVFARFTQPVRYVIAANRQYNSILSLILNATLGDTVAVILWASFSGKKLFHLNDLLYLV